MVDIQKLTPGELNFITRLLGFFNIGENAVLDNLSSRFIEDVKILEAKHFYYEQLHIESVHSELYSLTIETLIKDVESKNKIFDALENFESIRMKNEWAGKWLGENTCFPIRCVALVCVEGLFFSGSFCGIFWLKKRSLMPGLTYSNELVSRDENIHCDFGVMLYHMLVYTKLKESEVHGIIMDAVVVEKMFIRDALGQCGLVGLNYELFSHYIEFVADRLSVQLGCNRIYNSSNPFDWMEISSLEGKTNFFEKKVSEYQKIVVSVTKGMRHDLYDSIDE
jgi:ribonucleotide reductase beta subunit family protein with ferritin-like domain